MRLKKLWTTMLIGLLALLLAACAVIPTPETVIVKETVIAEKEVTRVVEVEKEVEVTRVVEVEKIVTATPEPPTPTPELRVFFQDDFEDEASGWESSASEDVVRAYEDGQWHMVIRTSTLLAWSGHSELHTLDDFSLEVDVTQASGPDDNQFGVMFRYQDADNWYAFLISGDGYFMLRREFNGESSAIVRWTQVAAIRQGQRTNHLRLVAEGPQLSVFVNDELLAIAPDNTFRRGDIKLAVGTFEETDVHITFDNLKVTALE